MYSVDLEGLEIVHGTWLDTTNLSFIKAQNIKSIKLRKKSNVLVPAILGGVVGAGIGVLVGQSAANHREGVTLVSDGEEPVIAGVFLGGAGAGLGGIGKSKAKI